MLGQCHHSQSFHHKQKATDSYKLEVDILTFSVDVNGKKKKILDMKSSEIYTLI